MFIAFHRRLTRVTLPALAIALAGPARAQVVCYDGFEGYGANAQLESGNTTSEGNGRNGGTGWGGAYNVYNPIKDRVLIENRSSSPVSYTNGDIVLPGGIRALRFYNNADGSYAVRRPMGTVFEAAGGDTLWFSILFRTADGGGAARRPTRTSSRSASMTTKTPLPATRGSASAPIPSPPPLSPRPAIFSPAAPPPRCRAPFTKASRSRP